VYLYYARAHEAFNLNMWPEDYYDVDHKPAFVSIMGNQKARDTPAICLFFGGWGEAGVPRMPTWEQTRCGKPAYAYWKTGEKSESSFWTRQHRVVRLR
jgi:hypothetical protein